MTLVPEVKGYKAEKTAVTPSNPGADTKVIYKLTNAEPAKPTTNKDLGTTLSSTVMNMATKSRCHSLSLTLLVLKLTFTVTVISTGMV